MKIQNQIKRTLSEESSLLYLNDLLDKKRKLSRKEIAAEVCKRFKFFNHLGEPQIAGCAKALRTLNHSGHITLPATKNRKTSVKKSPQCLNSEVPQPLDVPAKVSDIEGLEFISVLTNEQKKIWNELMIREHPLGSGMFVGRQLRYLINSNHRYLGGIGFAAPALQLSQRDKWIGWDKEQRQGHLHQIVGMSRLLIRKSVKCLNLASKVLGMSVKIMVDDFEKRYGYKPILLESFVDEEWSGTCYQAAN